MVFNKYFENVLSDKIFSKFDILKKILNKKNTLFMLVTFLLSMQTFVGSTTFVFAYSILGVASVFNVPLILILISSVIGMLIAKISIVLILKLFVCFIVFTLFSALINIEGISKRYVVLIKLIISVIITETLILVFGSISNYSIFNSIYSIILVPSFYLVFLTGMYVILNYNKGFIYSKEETLAMFAIVIVSISFLKNFEFINFSVFYAISIFLMLIYGWKNGAVAGCASGLIIGLLMANTSNLSVIYISGITFAGFVAGLLNKFGKVGVAIGFIFGNVLINYLINNSFGTAVPIAEMALSLTLFLLISKKIELKLDKIFSNNLLNSPYVNVLDYGSDIKNRLGAVSEVFEELGDLSRPIVKEDLIETSEVIKRYLNQLIDKLKIESISNFNIPSEKEVNDLVEYLASCLESNKKIDEEKLGFLNSNSSQIVKNIEEVYNSMKLVRIIKQNQIDNSSRLSNQYKEVSKIISKVANNINIVNTSKNKYQIQLRNELKMYGYIVYEDSYSDDNGVIEYTFVTDILSNIDKQKKDIISITSQILEQNMIVKLILNSSKTEKSKIRLISKPKFEVQTSVASYKKDSEEVCGDSYLCMELPDLKQFNAISDGTGSGSIASKSSKTIINMLEKLLISGFDQTKSIELINNIIKLKSDAENISTLDTAIINLKTGDTEFIKFGAAPTYILEDNKLSVICPFSVPIGLVDENDYIPIIKKLKSNAIIVQISDGVVNDNMDINDNYFTRYLKQININKSTNLILDDLYSAVQKQNENKLKDDVTIIVTKLKENFV
ncbi:MAG: SpoIIE family protein phosphatase [Clostridia bacterium]|nr:SpoIIE family protein phosphatase [Clostridia bacterium]